MKKIPVLSVKTGFSRYLQPYWDGSSDNDTKGGEISQQQNDTMDSSLSLFSEMKWINGNSSQILAGHLSTVW